MSKNTTPPKTSHRMNSASSSGKWLLGLSIFVLILIAVGSGIAGFQANLQVEDSGQTAQDMMAAMVAAQEQFVLGNQALDAERYMDAKMHFEYVLKIDPAFPDIEKKLVAALIGIYAEPTQTPAPDPQVTPTITPTPEIPNEAELLYQAQDLVKNREWSLAIETLQALRAFHPEHQPAEVDGLLFTALYNRGMAYIGEGDLAGGVYDLERAARFGVLDVEGQNSLEWASFYLTGVSYWGIDWRKAVYYFSLIVDEAPGFQDASGATVQERYRDAVQQYAESLTEKAEWCEAERYFRIALEYGGEASLEAKVKDAAEMCEEKGG